MFQDLKRGSVENKRVYKQRGSRVAGFPVTLYNFPV